MPSFKCSDIGMACNFQAVEKTNEDLMERIKEHARRAHNIERLTPELEAKIKNAIK